MRLRKYTGRKALIVAAAAATLVVSTGIASVLAVHDEDFQLDADVLASTGTSIGHAQTTDWDSLFDAAGAEKTLPSNYTASGFTKDFTIGANNSFVTSDSTTYATGSKDTLPITGGWQCGKSNNVGDKVDILNAYSAVYQSGLDTILYFGVEKSSPPAAVAW